MFDRIPPPARAPILAFGLGAVAGGFEVIAMAATLRLHLELADAVALGVATVLIGGLVGAAWGGVAGLVLAVATRRWLPAARNGAGMAASAGLLAWWYLVPLALDKLDQGLAPAAIAFCLTPIGVIGVTWFNAHYWFRREDLGDHRRFGWWALSLGAGLALGLLGSLGLSGRDYGSGAALEGDPVVLQIAVDGLRSDALDATAPGAVPALIELVEAGAVRFDNAITPATDTRMAHAALFTGRHPVRLDLHRPDDRLARPYRTLAEVLEAEGYATGAFVSRAALGEASGLSQGFQVYDADLLPGLAGLSAVRPVELALALRGDALAPRPDRDTVIRATAWMRATRGRPFFAHVHLAGPWGAAASGDASAYAAATADLDTRLRALLADARDVADGAPVVVVVTGTHGLLLGEHGGQTGHGALWDEVVRVPLVILPHKLAAKTREVPFQVRLMDVPATLLDLLRLDPIEQAEGADLMKFAEGLRTKHFSSLLVSPGADPVVLGYRAAMADESGNIKFVTDAKAGRTELYDLIVDPGEATNIAEQQPAAVEALRARIDQEAGRYLRGER